MSAEVIGLKGDTVPNVISAFTIAAARTMKTLIRKWTRTRWWVLFAIVAAAGLAVIAIKLLALFAAAFDISFLRSAGDTTGPAAAAGAAGAGAAGVAAGGGSGGGSGGSGGGSGDPQPYHDPYLNYVPDAHGKTHPGPRDSSEAGWGWVTGDSLAPIFGGTRNHPPPSDPWFTDHRVIDSVSVGRRGGAEAGSSSESLGPDLPH